MSKHSFVDDEQNTDYFDKIGEVGLLPLYRILQPVNSIAANDASAEAGDYMLGDFGMYACDPILVKFSEVVDQALLGLMDEREAELPEGFNTDDDPEMNRILDAIQLNDQNDPRLHNVIFNMAPDSWYDYIGDARERGYDPEKDVAISVWMLKQIYDQDMPIVDIAIADLMKRPF